MTHVKDHPARKIVLSMRGVEHSYQGTKNAKTIFDHLNLTVREREFVAIMGPSGCGKSTLLNIVAGFEKSVAGAVEVAGKPVKGPGADRGVVFQKPTLFPWMSVLENVTYGLKATGRGRDASSLAESMLKEVGLEGHGQYKTYELSGGMQHRVAIARTLVGQPELLLMDEPFGALDAQTRSEMQALLLDIWQRHRNTVIFVTHDIEEGLLLADRVVVLGRGGAGVQAEVQVDIPRPRAYETVMTDHFIELRKQLRQLISDAT